MFKIFRWAFGNMTAEEIVQDMVAVRKRLDFENSKPRPDHVLIRDLLDDIKQLERRKRNADRKIQNPKSNR